MLNWFVTGAEQIFLACGATDFRKQADSLAAIVSMQFHLDPFADQCVFLFCNRKRNGIKILRYDSNGFILASKKLLDGMKFQWPKTPKEVNELKQHLFLVVRRTEINGIYVRKMVQWN